MRFIRWLSSKTFELEKMKLNFAIALCLLLGSLPNQAQAKEPSFEDFPAKKYTGKIILPKWIKREGPDEWRDQFDKLVDEPEINFAGKFFVALHSCGTFCRYYTLTDLSTGKESGLLDHFNTGQPEPKTTKGLLNVSNLRFTADSNLIVVEYMVKLPSGEQCREKKFVLDKKELRPVTKLRVGCK